MLDYQRIKYIDFRGMPNFRTVLQSSPSKGYVCFFARVSAIAPPKQTPKSVKPGCETRMWNHDLYLYLPHIYLTCPKMLALFQGPLGQALSTHRWRFDRHFAVRLARLDGPRECDLRLPQSDAGLWLPGARRRLVDLVGRKRSAEWLENVDP